MEEEEHLSLRWDEHTLTFVHLLNHFRIQKLYCDASLACAGGVVYPVHKVVLSACSDFFASIFASTTCTNPVVVLQDVAKEHLQALLTYLYQGEVLVARSDLPAFLKVAENLQIKGLATHHQASFNMQNHTVANPISQYPKDPYPTNGTWDREGYERIRTKRISQGEEDCSHRPPRKRYSPQIASSPSLEERMFNGGPCSGGGGGFQTLVASEEREIKEEPADESTEFEEEKLTICDREEERMEEEEEEEAKKEEEKRRDEEKEGSEERREGRMEEGKDMEGKEEDVKVMLDTEHQHQQQQQQHSHTKSQSMQNAHSSIIENSQTLTPTYPTLPTKSPTPAHQPCSPSQPHALSPTPAHPAHTPIPATPITTSQLRRELLKPLHYRGLPNPQHSIPHPVIASPDWAEDEEENSGELEVLRDPPPLVKIPSPSSPSSSSPMGTSSSSSSSSPPLHHHLPHHHYRYSNQHLHLTRQMDERNENHTTMTTTITTSPTTSPTLLTSAPNKGHQHLLVTTQPTYIARLSSRPNLTSHTTPYNYSTYRSYKDMDLDTEGPLNLSQDTHVSTRNSRVNTSKSEYERNNSDGDPFLGKILTNRKRRLRGPKSWEYLVRLLHDPSTNPSLIRWENEAKGVFRLVEPAAIAQRWGRRTGKHASECLTYENFARGLRYHYATGALEPVSERSFVYKFGPRAVTALGEAKGGGGGEDCNLIPTTNTNTTTNNNGVVNEIQPAITHI